MIDSSSFARMLDGLTKGNGVFTMPSATELYFMTMSAILYGSFTVGCGLCRVVVRVGAGH